VSVNNLDDEVRTEGRYHCHQKCSNWLSEK